jgi:hypothetical protein
MLLAIDKQNEPKTKWCSADSYRRGHNRTPSRKQITDTFVEEEEALPNAF